MVNPYKKAPHRSSKDMTHFYVCLRNQGGYKQWHAGITDAPTFKKRSYEYEDCILWEDLGTRKNALRLEAITG